MNYLAHIFLSGNDNDIMLGNFFADAVKGKTYLNYPEKIQKGILLHREIDYYSDNHPVIMQSKQRLYDTHHLFSRVIVDVFHDHFLALKFSKYSSTPLNIFARKFYANVYRHYFILPTRFKKFYPIMVGKKLLTSYADLAELDVVFYQMAKRSEYKSNMEVAVDSLKKDYNLYEQEFDLFFPDMVDHANNWLVQNME